MRLPFENTNDCMARPPLPDTAAPGWSGGSVCSFGSALSG